MSVQLGVWPQDVPLTLQALAQDLGAATSGELVLGFGPDLEMIESPETSSEEIMEPHPAVAGFYAELTARLPDLTEDNYLCSPWAEPLTIGRHAVLMSVVFSRVAEVCRLVTDLADRHDLHCFAPRDLPLRPAGPGAGP
ncbi:hypothetical protein [Nonomuraea sp. NPDC048916]|uniref:hypothetical protein n=1 Tax=Nonomuraea sp. NPDC048916 TaxID=3154232 RepID=UPI0033C9134C